MQTIWAIRELCAEENGFVNLFNKEKSYQKLLDLSDEKEEATLFAALLYGGAREALLALLHDTYNYEAHGEKVRARLMAEGMSEADAKRALAIFYEAFGFPNYRHSDPAKVGTLHTEDGDFRTEYTGEVRNGKEHGVGARTCYYNGKFCNYDECVWVDGVMCGYDNAKEVEFEQFEDKKIGFVANDFWIGNVRIFASSGEEFDDIGKKLNIK